MVRYLKFEIITDDRFKNLEEHEQKINKLDELLSKITTFTHYATQDIFFEGENNRQKRTKYIIQAKNKGITWNDVYKTVNTIYAPFYKFI